MAEKYEAIPGARELIGSHVAPAMLEAVHLDKDTTTVLDFGCGIGLLSRELESHVKSIVGVDISKVSVDVYNRLASEAGAADKMRAVALDLQSAPDELEGKKFDVVTCSMVYHHIHSPESHTKTLVQYLKPNGKLIISSLMHRENFDQSKYPDMMRVAAPNMQGFKEDAIRKMFEDAGLREVKYRKVWGGLAPAPPTMSIPDEERMIEVFVAEGTKAAV
ncbi:S-adenosyl-L-methionine-dependent methyltransferase [Peniophora sp. CONT]|nr:S-adenosyl-L-methionine-dependent methyltransferase [Peniophora sp. CONT]